MENASATVTQEEFRNYVVISLGQIQQLLNHIKALETILLQNQTISPSLLKDALEKSGNNEHARKVREAIAKLQGRSTILDILKDFQGPIQ